MAHVNLLVDIIGTLRTPHAIFDTAALLAPLGNITTFMCQIMRAAGAPRLPFAQVLLNNDNVYSVANLTRKVHTDAIKLQRVLVQYCVRCGKFSCRIFAIIERTTLTIETSL